MLLQVFVLAKNHRPHLNHLQYTYLPCDISDFEALKQAISGQDFQYVLHLASINEGNLDNYPERALFINSLGTRNLLDVLKDKTSLKQFVYFSTFQVYGSYEGIITEGTKINPKNDYAITHYFAERYIQHFHSNHQLPYTIFRLTNSYGCPKDLNTSKWYLILNDLARSAFLDQRIQLRSNGKSLRDFIWMGDVCTITEKIILLEAPPNTTLNLAGESSIQIIDIAKIVQQAYFEEFGLTIPIQINHADHSKYPTNLLVKTERLKNMLSFTLHNKMKEEVKEIFKLVSKSAPEK